MLVQLDHFPQTFGVKIQNIWNHQLVTKLLNQGSTAPQVPPRVLYCESSRVSSATPIFWSTKWGSCCLVSWIREIKKPPWKKLGWFVDVFFLFAKVPACALFGGIMHSSHNSYVVLTIVHSSPLKGPYSKQNNAFCWIHRSGIRTGTYINSHFNENWHQQSGPWTVADIKLKYWWTSGSFAVPWFSRM